MNAQELFDNIINGISEKVTEQVMQKVNARLEEFKTQLPSGGGSGDFTDAQQQAIKELAGEVVDNIDIGNIDGFEYAVKQAVRDLDFTVDVS